MTDRDGGGNSTNEFGAVALDASERIIVVGHSFDPANEDIDSFLTVRYTTSGARDPSFGDGGGVGVAYLGGTGYRLCPNQGDNFDLCDRVGLNAVALQPDGTIVAAGFRGFADISDANFVVGRLSSSGEPDVSFGTNGSVETSFGVTDRALAMALDSAGRIVVAGQADGSMALARYFSAPPPPVACEPGFYSADGFAPCTPAPPGTFVATSGATEATPAPPGTFVDQEGATEATDCAVGTFQPDEGQTACLLAPAGSFVAEAGATEATACAVGTFQPDEGQTACLPAPPGRYVDAEGAAEALACAVGTYQPDEGQTSCLPAPVGTYVNAVAATEATACPAGQTTLGEGSTSADACLVLNEPPVITAVLVPADPTAVGVDVAVSAPFTDPDAGDTHDCSIDYGDDSDVEINQAEGLTCTGTHAYAAAGIYTVSVTVTDAAGESDTETATDFVVVYDPSAGFVTGGGWIDSPEGAYVPEPTLTGRASFGFVAKYKKGRSTPDGNTQFQFNAAGLSFYSTAYDWLVIAGTRAKFKGVGTIDGMGDFGFMLTATDADADLFRIKIWERTDGAVVYDNQMGEGEDSDAGTALGGGQIVIHSQGRGNSATGGSSASKGSEGGVPEAFALQAAYPNPFAASATIAFDVPETAHVRLVVYDVLGRAVAVLADGPFEAARHAVVLDGRGLPAGTYLVRMTTEGASGATFVQTQRLTLVR